MARIEPETRDGVYGIFLDLEIDAALRTYVVHDVLPWGGVTVRDGGLWLTYDIPSFVDTLLTKGKPTSVGNKDGDQFRMRDRATEIRITDSLPILYTPTGCKIPGAPLRSF
jgi:hypothetical protein